MGWWFNNNDDDGKRGSDTKEHNASFFNFNSSVSSISCKNDPQDPKSLVCT